MQVSERIRQAHGKLTSAWLVTPKIIQMLAIFFGCVAGGFLGTWIIVATLSTVLLYPPGTTSDFFEVYGDVLGGLFTFGAAVVAWVGLREEQEGRVLGGLMAAYPWAIDLFNVGLHRLQELDEGRVIRIEKTWEGTQFQVILQSDALIQQAAILLDAKCSEWNRYVDREHALDGVSAETIRRERDGITGDRPYARFLLEGFRYRAAVVIERCAARVGVSVRPEVAGVLSAGRDRFDPVEGRSASTPHHPTSPNSGSAPD